MQEILGLVRRCVEDYDMIQAGDTVAVGVSGGKDSLLTLTALARLSRFYPKPFRVVAMTVEAGTPGMSFDGVADYCRALGVEYIRVNVPIYEVVFLERREKNPCSLCAKLRRGALHNTAKKYGCNKVALGHHFDDVIETFFLCLFYEGRLGCFSPVTYLDRQDIHVIRPLIYMTENDIKSFIRRSGSPVIHNPCPADGFTKRQYIKELLASLAKENPGLPERIFHAVLSLPDWKRE